MRSLNSYKGIHKGETCAVLGGAVTLPADLRAIPQVDILIGVNQHSLILPLDYLCFLDRHMWPYVEGFRDILKVTPLNKFASRDDVIHIHPSLLPKYKGLNTHQRAIDNNEKFSGCTVHYVTEKLDSGKIISQKKVKILKKDNAVSLAKKILQLEHKLFPETLDKICKKLAKK